MNCNDVISLGTLSSFEVDIMVPTILLDVNSTQGGCLEHHSLKRQGIFSYQIPVGFTRLEEEEQVFQMKGCWNPSCEHRSLLWAKLWFECGPVTCVWVFEGSCVGHWEKEGLAFFGRFLKGASILWKGRRSKKVMQEETLFQGAKLRALDKRIPLWGKWRKETEVMLGLNHGLNEELK